MHIGNFQLENFKQKNNFGYIPAHLDTNVLNCICSDTFAKVEVAKTIVLSVKRRNSEYFLTDFHVK